MWFMRFKTSLLASLFLLLVIFNNPPGFGQTGELKLPKKFPLPANPIELTRGARPNVYFQAVGRKAGILGHESGTFESGLPWSCIAATGGDGHTVFPAASYSEARVP